MPRRRDVLAAMAAGSATLAGLSTTAAGQPPAAPPTTQPGSAFGRVEVVAPDALPVAVQQLSTPTSTDLLLDLRVDVRKGEGPQHQTRVVTLRVPMAVPEGVDFLGYLQSFTGSVFKTSGARVAIVADLAGTTTVLDFPTTNKQPNTPPPATRPATQPATRPTPPVVEGEPEETRFSPQLFSLLLRYSEQRRPEGAGPLPVPPYEATILVAVHRLSMADSAEVIVESLGVDAVPYTSLPRPGGPPAAVPPAPERAAARPARGRAREH